VLGLVTWARRVGVGVRLDEGSGEYAGSAGEVFLEGVVSEGSNSVRVEEARPRMDGGKRIKASVVLGEVDLGKLGVRKLADRPNSPPACHKFPLFAVAQGRTLKRHQPIYSNRNRRNKIIPSTQSVPSGQIPTRLVPLDCS
jgi:hypothetical protein